MKIVVWPPMIRSDVTPYKLKPLGRNIKPDFFVNLADNAIQKTLVTLAATTKKAELPRI